ncbi:MAG: exo-alpha-sialidase [Bacteroidota bacterium]|jgi:photosystem II stability/assembly factor-like uncharacterized protein
MAKQKKTYLLVGTQKGAFILTSNSQRKKWTLTGPLLKGAEVNDIMLDVRRKPTMYASVNSYWWGSNVHMSTDWGKTWKQSEGGLRFKESSGKKVARAWCVKPGPASEPNVLYAGVDPGALFKTEDSGQTWTEFESLSDHPTRKKWAPGAGGLMVHSIVPHPTDPKQIFVGISAAGAFVTQDGGVTWEARNKNVLADFHPEKYPEAGQCVHHLESHPSTPSVLYQQNHCGVYRSDNGGKDWIDISKGLPSRFGFPIQIHPHEPDTVFVVPEEGAEFRASATGAFAVYRSTNRGATWKKMTKGLPAKPSFLHVHRQAMTHDELQPFGLYVATTNGQIFWSRDNGTSWKVLAENLPAIYSINAATA